MIDRFQPPGGTILENKPRVTKTLTLVEKKQEAF